MNLSDRLSGSAATLAWCLILLGTAGSSFWLFLRLASGRSTDIALHCEIAQHSLVTGSWLPNFLYYWLIAALTLFSPNLDALKVAAAVILSAAVVARLHLSYRIGRWFLGVGSFRRDLMVAGLCLLVAVSFSFPRGSSRYLGQIPPTVWHNSTTIAVAPLALALFWVTYRYLVYPEARLLAYSTVLVVANAGVKPSFLFCILGALPFMLLRRFGWHRDAWAGMIPVVVAAGLLGFQYWVLFEGPRDSGVLYPAGGGVRFAPLRQWNSFSDNIAASFMLSLAFPVSVVLLRWPDVRRSLFFGYATGCMAVGLAIFTLLQEVGPREGHGNFFWQVVLANNILFLASGLICLRDSPRRPRTRGGRLTEFLPLAVLLAHAVFGLRYIAQLAVTGTYR